MSLAGELLRCASLMMGYRIHRNEDSIARALIDIVSSSKYFYKFCLITVILGVVVYNIFPRFSRKSGGSTITVKGENFGLSGSKSIIRIAGKKSTFCWYPPNEFVPDSAPTNTNLLAAHCSDGVLDFDEDKTDCGGTDCPPCIANILPVHCSNGILDYDETAVGVVETKLGIQDCGGSCLSPASCCDGKQDNDETGVDCGGSVCQPCNRKDALSLSCAAVE